MRLSRSSRSATSQIFIGKANWNFDRIAEYIELSFILVGIMGNYQRQIAYKYIHRQIRL